MAKAVHLTVWNTDGGRRCDTMAEANYYEAREAVVAYSERTAAFRNIETVDEFMDEIVMGQTTRHLVRNLINAMDEYRKEDK